MENTTESPSLSYRTVIPKDWLVFNDLLKYMRLVDEGKFEEASALWKAKPNLQSLQDDINKYHVITTSESDKC